MTTHHRRLATLLALVVLATVIAATEPLHRAARTAIELAEPIIQRHAVAGAVVYVLLSALSAMVVFFSAAVITPVAIDAFGPLTALLLLWIGWVLGGMSAYAIGRFLGRRVVSWFVDPKKLHQYELRAQRLVLFRHVLLFQLAVPSEVPGYVLGLAGCRFRTFAAAMALGELPFAIGAVYLGESFLERNYVLLLTIGIAGVVFSWLVLRRAAKMWAASDRETDDGRPVEPMRLVVNHDERGDGGDEEPEVLVHAESERGV
jgi:uncharacterized membrane protein YdjX (TVP38/TMEM64 family)